MCQCSARFQHVLCMFFFIFTIKVQNVRIGQVPKCLLQTNSKLHFITDANCCCCQLVSKGSCAVSGLDWDLGVVLQDRTGRASWLAC